MEISNLTSQITNYKYAKTIFRLSVFALLAAVIVLMFPRYNNAFRYHYEICKPWGYNALTADFDFPIYKTDDQQQAVLDYCARMKQRLEAKGLRVKFDDRDTQKPGFKFAEWEMKGVPVRLAAGPRDVENQTVEIARRDTLTKQSISEAEMEDHILGLLDEIQDSLYNRALEYRKANTHRVDTWDEFKQVIENGGFAYAHWDGTTETELAIKEETKATLRCIPLDDDYEDGVDVFSGKPSKRRVIFAKAY